MAAKIDTMVRQLVDAFHTMEVELMATTETLSRVRINMRKVETSWKRENKRAQTLQLKVNNLERRLSKYERLNKDDEAV